MLFCDLVGSTELAGRLDPEDLREVIRAYQDACAGAIVRFEGHVAKFMGDGVLAYFGYPAAHEDDAERAVCAGLQAVRAVGALAPCAGAPLAARVGIATGLVVVGDLVGEGAAQEQAVVGETPNLAARLQALAEPGSVVVASTTRRLLGGMFEYADLGVHRLEGLRRTRPGLAGARQQPRGGPLRGAPRGRSDATGRPRARARPAARPLAAGQGGRGPGGAPRRRARGRQVPPGPRAARAARRRGVHARSATSARPTTRAAPSTRSSTCSSGRQGSRATTRPSGSSTSSRR